MTEKAVESVIKSIEDFTVDFHKNVASKTKGNFVSSALSAHLVLTMAAYGADGNTTKEIRQALRLPDNDQQVHQGYQNLIDTLNNAKKVRVNAATKIYVPKDISIQDQFKQISSNYFRSETATIDFSKAAESAAIINEWCVEKTNGKINNVVTPDDIHGCTGLVLFNAVYFKGTWEKLIFESETQLEPFHVNKTTTVEVPMMHTKNHFFYEDLPELNAEAVGHPYENSDFLFVMIIPKEIDGLADLEKNLENIQLDLRRCTVDLAFPRFKIETTIDLSSPFTDLGMKEMFTNIANFEGISNVPLKVDKVLQKVFIDVNEKGTEAICSFNSLMTKCKRYSNVQVIVDRPFLYKITYKGSTLFSGHVVNPIEK